MVVSTHPGLYFQKPTFVLHSHFYALPKEKNASYKLYFLQFFCFLGNKFEINHLEKNSAPPREQNTFTFIEIH